MCYIYFLFFGFLFFVFWSFFTKKNICICWFFVHQTLSGPFRDSTFSIHTSQVSFSFSNTFLRRSKLCLQGPVNGTYKVIDLDKVDLILGSFCWVKKSHLWVFRFQSWIHLSHSLGFSIKGLVVLASLGFYHSVRLLQTMWMNIHVVCILAKWPIRAELILGVFLLPLGWDARSLQRYRQH